MSVKIFAISIPRSVKRHAHIQRHLSQKTSLEWELVGVDGADLRAQSQSWDHSPNLTNAQIGCALSHATACQKIADSGHKAGLIIEDDVILPDDMDSLIAAVAAEIRPDEMISFYMRTMRTEKFTTRHAVKIGTRQLVAPLEARSVRCGAAYMLGAEAARNIAKGNNPVKYVADNWEAFYKEGWVRQYRLLHPVPIRFIPFQSTLASDRDSGGLRVAKKIMRFVPFAGLLRNMRRERIERRREQNIVLVDEPSLFAR